LVILTASRINKKEGQDRKEKNKERKTINAWKRRAQEVKKARAWNTEDNEMRKSC
jgi:hypothetical protein